MTLTAPLLDTTPVAPGDDALLLRPRLMRRLDEARPGGITLISAPAGFGKTVLLEQWIAQRDDDRSILRLQLTADDGMRTLAAKLVRALGWLAAPVDPRVFEYVEGRGRNLAGPFRAALLDAFSRIPAGILVVEGIDAASAAVAAELSALLAEAPPRLRIVASSRARVPATVMRA